MAYTGMVVPGTRLSTTQGEHYQIDSLLGSGGFGIAYRAVDLTTAEPVVIKVLRPDVAVDPDAALQFAREAEAAQLVNHPHVVRTLAYVGAGDSGIDAPYLVMEYISGGDLQELLIAQGGAPLHQGTVIDWMTQLAQGLQAIHAHVLHRDLKPQNVLVDGTLLKISDFGMSKYVESVVEEISFDVDGYPPVKGGDWSMFSRNKNTGPRIKALLLQALKRIEEVGDFSLFVDPVGLEVVVYGTSDRGTDPGAEADATNYLGGIADTLEVKTYHVGQHASALHPDLSHDLMSVALYQNDKLIREVRYRQESASAPHYTVRIWQLASPR